ncbi:MAG: serine--tRNA ligase [Candidatus Cloacimonetes bacterium]|nr:serine--tRNA ligase [Candidatus Cloacimonadota bacterium]
MLDIKFIRENAELLNKTAIDKKIKFDAKDLLDIDKAKNSLQEELDVLRAQLNEGNKQIRTLSNEERPAHIVKMKAVSEKVKAMDEKARELKSAFNIEMLKVPSPLHETTPIGNTDEDNVVVSTWGELPKFDFEPKSHMTLGDELDIIDVERGVKLSGARSYFLKNEGTLLEIALMRYALDFLVKRGFTPMTVPQFVKSHAMTGTGYFPGGEDQTYKLGEDDLYMIGTAEVPLASYHYDEILDQKQFPIKLTAWSDCFRREAGTYGKDTHGLYRIHQFQKVEQVYIMENDEEASLKAHQYLLDNAVDFVKSLGIPHQITDVCSGDIGQGQVKKFDINSWMPSRNAYCETHSCSMFYEFQARRLKMRYRDENGKMKFCHTLNNTLIASPRVLIPVLELNQTKEGTIKIPEVLLPYMHGITEIKPK